MLEIYYNRREKTNGGARGVFDNYCPFSSSHRPNITIYIIYSAAVAAIHPLKTCGHTLHLHIITILYIYTRIHIKRNVCVYAHGGVIWRVKPFWEHTCALILTPRSVSRVDYTYIIWYICPALLIPPKTRTITIILMYNNFFTILSFYTHTHTYVYMCLCVFLFYPLEFAPNCSGPKDARASQLSRHSSTGTHVVVVVVIVVVVYIHI